MADRLVPIDTDRSSGSQFPALVQDEIEAVVVRETPDAVTDYLEGQEITFTDEGDGEGYFSVGGVPVSGTLVPPAATWSGVAGRPFVTTTEFSPAADGATDDSGVIQDALDSIPAISTILVDSVTGGNYDSRGGGRIVIPPGVYAIDGPLTVQPRTTIEAYGVTLVATDATACITIPENPIEGLFTGTQGGIKGLTFDGAGVATNGIILEATRLAGLDDCTVMRTTGDGYILVGSQWSVLTRCQARQCGGWGLTLVERDPTPGCNNNVINRFYSQTNAGGGTRILGNCMANTFVGLTSQYNETGVGVYIAGIAQNNAFLNPHLENNQWDIHISASDGTYEGSPTDNLFIAPELFSQFNVETARTERYVVNEGFRTRISHPATDSAGPQKQRNGVAAAYEQASDSGSMIVEYPNRMAGSGVFASDGSLMFVDETGADIDPATEAHSATASRLIVPELKDLRQSAEVRFAKLTLAAATAIDRLALKLEGDADNRLQVRADGRITWSDGAGAQDIYLYRIAAGAFGVQGTVRPSVVDTYDLGVGGAPWRRVYFGVAGTAPHITSGAGSPEGSITANPGSLYTNTSGGAGTTLYVKESGSGNTGWTAMASA